MTKSSMMVETLNVIFIWFVTLCVRAPPQNLRESARPGRMWELNYLFGEKTELFRPDFLWNIKDMQSDQLEILLTSEWRGLTDALFPILTSIEMAFIIFISKNIRLNFHNDLSGFLKKRKSSLFAPGCEEILFLFPLWFIENWVFVVCV